MKIKGIPCGQVKAEALRNPKVKAAWLAEKKRRRITNSVVSRLERNASKASLITPERYAAACESSIKISAG